jgi:hypothetical protein
MVNASRVGFSCLLSEVIDLTQFAPVLVSVIVLAPAGVGLG